MASHVIRKIQRKIDTSLKNQTDLVIDQTVRYKTRASIGVLVWGSLFGQVEVQINSHIGRTVAIAAKDIAEVKNDR